MGLVTNLEKFCWIVTPVPEITWDSVYSLIVSVTLKTFTSNDAKSLSNAVPTILIGFILFCNPFFTGVEILITGLEISGAVYFVTFLQALPIKIIVIIVRKISIYI